MVSILYFNFAYNFFINNWVWLSPFLSALFGASLTQIINYLLTKRREKASHTNNSLKSFYYKVMPPILEFYSLETNFMKVYEKQNIKVDNIFQEITDLVLHSTPFITPKIYNTFLSVRKNNNFDDPSGFMKQLYELELMACITEEYLKILNKVSIKISKEQVWQLYLLFLWRYLIYASGDYEQSKNPIKQTFNFDTEKLKKKQIKKLTREIKEIIKIEDNYDLSREKFEKHINKMPFTFTEAEEKQEFLNVLLNNDTESEIANDTSITFIDDIFNISGTLTRDLREELRLNLISKLYDYKYSPDIELDENIPDLSNLSFEQFRYLNNELKNAIFYYEDKNFLKIIKYRNSLKIELTAHGQDFYENLDS